METWGAALGAVAILAGFAEAFGAAPVVALEPTADLIRPDVYDLEVPRGEARAALNGLLDHLASDGDSQTGGRRETLHHALKLSHSYRSLKSTSILPLKEAPYLGLVLLERTSELYPAAYDEAWRREYERMVVHVPLETLLDGFMQAILDGTLPAAIRREAKGIDACLARKVLAGKGPRCVLDPSDRISEPSFAQMFWVKMDCSLHLNAMDTCHIRKVIYNKAKRALISARGNPDVRRIIEQAFGQRFPQEFRDGFLAELARQYQGFPQLLTAKFNGQFDAQLWGPKSPLVEPDDEAQGRISTLGFAKGLSADIRLAAELAATNDPKLRGAASALFYAAANRLLMLMGGSAAVWNGQTFQIVGSPNVDPRRPRDPPVFAGAPFGGWGLDFVSGSPIVFSAWDWETYDPATKLRIFPSVFQIGARGAPRLAPNVTPVQGLADISALASALVDFLRATRSDGPLARYFGEEDQMGDLLKPDSPLIFPKRGRVLAVGVLGAVLQNLIHSHLELGEGTDLRFYDRLGPSGREGNPVPVEAVGRLLLTASDVQSILGDPDVPEQLRAFSGRLEAGLLLGSVLMSNIGMNGDGGFRSVWGQSLESRRSLADAVPGLRSLIRSYNYRQVLLTKLAIQAGWNFLDRFWGDRRFPSLIEGEGGHEVSPSLLWEILLLWREAQAHARPGIGSDIDWSKWEQRMGQLEWKLKEQLYSETGPAPVGALVE